VNDAPEDVLEPVARELTRTAIDSQILASVDWPAVTYCDRLDRAFAELNRSGIVCRQNFSCCGNCGVAEIGDEMQAEQDGGLNVRGYAFYHMQDTESAAEGYGLFLNYGSVDRGEDSALGIANEIVDALQRHGLTTLWNGSWRNRIGVQLDWKRRLSTDL
jgi:hypothetical protein